MNEQMIYKYEIKSNQIYIRKLYIEKEKEKYNFFQPVDFGCLLKKLYIYIFLNMFK
jgi:hypothetical protein